MAYADGNPRTKRILKEWVAAGRRVEVFNPSGLFPVPTDGKVALEGPHYPAAHTWYASAVLQDGVIVKVT